MTEWWSELFNIVNTEVLIKFLRDINLLDESDLQILIIEKINGLDFISFSRQDFHLCGLKWGPAIRLIRAAWEIRCKNWNLLPPNTRTVLSTLSKSLDLPPVTE
ncbi:hypothetical protein RhiirA1_412994 [Rhizophagus irregularis]|uniref:Uncharacterized protein n=3 Tax=Rhizophagus irregularis TaxID=588596 RepID=U9SYD5_RHIID|nr:hypothetical protein GLOIN_2v1471778 [Rhizophagus irregularis DAOM 181602=DAOM 197198]EXX56283.1 hypothetical protein RirG_217880 [Rhizophagus irregularis DAOM 197198w]PKC71581.1 hypothetical protein RhiirA1_412994 [Rhizophagus irregularis]POG80276.1 hypothetical protein GLOIN_2v1471778 [Rhizophagus irregularis DAOM 181602=DAOM 197198]UZO01860.1 hypothetical protein OCT59_020369 [Rhizophagus irregularis]CAB4380309.1 unnamed protein product [Rhizophagus irregularis]|eukprot:XP_025187142.1 hypothetical protein GLOIN_2v1471778 [Rhizophagus irregularis DAOM 181602=DAOM 197198]